METKLEQFKVICKKCLSEDVEFEMDIDTKEAGHESYTMVVTCNSCHQEERIY